MNLRVLAAKYALGMLVSDDLSTIAAELLAAGVESHSLACLAGSTRTDPPADLRDLFVTGLRERDVAVPGRLDAAWILRLHLAEEVAKGRQDPEAGAGQMVGLYHRVYDLLPAAEAYAGDAFGIAKVLGLYYSLDDVAPDDRRRQHILREIVDECRVIASTVRGHTGR